MNGPRATLFKGRYSGAVLYHCPVSAFWDSVNRDLLTGISGDSMDPKAWVASNGEFAWSKQADILQSILDNRYTAVHSAHDLGKSFIASRIIAWWIASHPVGEAFVVSTAPSAAQVGAIMWREVAKIHRKADLIGKINRAGYPQWYVDGELVGYGRKPADYEQSAFQGIHAKYVLVVIDEACGVPKHLYDAIDALATNEHARVLAIGNPDDPASHFSSVCKPGSGWNVIHLDGLRSPNLTYERVVGDDPAHPKWPLLAALMEAEGVPYSTETVPDDLRPMLIDERWIEERIERWAMVPRSLASSLPPEELQDRVQNACGKSALFTAKVRGLFPASSSEGIIPLGWIQAAVNRWMDLQGYDGVQHSLRAREPGSLTVGVDVARTGNDETCLALRYGSYVQRLERVRLTDTMDVVALTASYMHEPGSTGIIDVIGIGSGVYDRLRQMKNQGEIVGTPIPFNASRATGRRDRLGQFQFFNDRAAAWWGMREKLDPAFGSKVALPDDERMIEELAAPKYELYANGKLKVESKDDIRRRLGRSTDAADAVIQSFWAETGGGTMDYEEYVDKPTKPGHREVYNYDGYDPFTDEDMSTGLGRGNLSEYGVTLGRSPDRPYRDPIEDWWNE